MSASYNLTRDQRQRLIRAHRIDMARNVFQADFKPRDRDPDDYPRQPCPWWAVLIYVGSAALMVLGMFFRW